MRARGSWQNGSLQLVLLTQRQRLSQAAGTIITFIKGHRRLTRSIRSTDQTCIRVIVRRLHPSTRAHGTRSPQLTDRQAAAILFDAEESTTGGKLPSPRARLTMPDVVRQLVERHIPHRSCMTPSHASCTGHTRLLPGAAVQSTLHRYATSPAAQNILNCRGQGRVPRAARTLAMSRDQLAAVNSVRQ
jgi:hypothetical protein